MKVIVNRTLQDNIQTLGEGRVVGIQSEEYRCVEKTHYTFKTLELPWKGNKRNESCIPAGTYRCIKHISPKFGRSFWIRNVPGRSEILVHKGNFYTDILGCVLSGKEFIDIDGDGHKDVTSSADTIDELWDVLPDEFDIQITNP